MNFIEKTHHMFDSRILFGGAMVNINGETFDCTVVKKPNGSYDILVNGKPVCDSLWEYHIQPFGGGVPAPMFCLQRVSDSNGDGTLILPLLWARESDEDDDIWDD